MITSPMPYAIEAYERMSEIYLEKKDAKNAIGTLREAAALNPTAETVHERLGILYYNGGELAKAKEEFLQELKLNSSAKESKRYLKLIEKAEGKAASAASVVKKEGAETKAASAASVVKKEGAGLKKADTGKRRGIETKAASAVKKEGAETKGKESGEAQAPKASEKSEQTAPTK
jgi:tetratricopeptide (TPR) repeat protein